MKHDSDSLSPAGLRRADAILDLALQALDERVRARRARRAGGAALALAVAAVALTPLVVRSPRTEPASSGTTAVAAIRFECLSDEALLDELAKLGIDAGLIDVAGTKRVVHADGTPLATRPTSS